jgi:hypothetical protein
MPTEAEWLTRKTRIDKKLGATKPGWTIVPYRKGLDTGELDRHAVAEFPTDNGPADYALFVNGRWLGIIEAKKVGTGPQNVLEQARRYKKWIYGEGRPHLSFEHLRKTVVCLPPLPEQKEIVRRVERLFALADQIEARYAKAKAQIDRLTPSLLAKAFRGELVPQDPSDEPAEAMLERIKRMNLPAGQRRLKDGKSAGDAP